MGVGVSYDDFSFGFGYRFGFLNSDNSNGFNQYDLRLGHSWEKVAIDAGYSKYSGFHIVNSKGFVDAEIPQHSSLARKDLELEALSADAYYLLWTDGFLLGDALSTNPNRGNGQGYLAILSIDRANVHDSTGLVPESARGKFAGSPGLTDIDLSLIAVQLGYGVSHNWDGLFLNALFSFGYGLQYASYDSDAGQSTKSGIASKLGMKAAIGYAQGNFFGGLLVGIEEPRYELDDVYLETSRQQLVLFVGSSF